MIQTIQCLDYGNPDCLILKKKIVLHYRIKLLKYICEKIFLTIYFTFVIVRCFSAITNYS